MNKLIDAVKTFLSGVEYMEQEENANYVVTKEDKGLLQEAINTVVAELEKPTYTDAERFDAEDWLNENKDIWNHPIIGDRLEKNGYEVADLMAEFANWYYKNNRGKEATE